jgi:hypothetical protein
MLWSLLAQIPRVGGTVSSNPRLAIGLEAGSDLPNPEVSVGPR